MLEFSSDDPLAEPALSALYHAAPDARAAPTLRYRLENQSDGWVALAPKKAPFGPGTLEEAFGFLEWRATEDIMASRDAVFLHAAGVRLGDKNVLIVGASGAGKSTLAAHLFTRGHQLWGDDMVQFTTTQRQFSAVQRSLKLDANTLESLSLLAVLSSEGTRGTLFAPHAVYVSPAALRQNWQAPKAVADAVVLLEEATHRGPARLEMIGAAEAALIAARALMGGGTSSNSGEQAELMARVLEAMSDLKAYRAAGTPASAVADALERVMAS